MTMGNNIGLIQSQNGHLDFKDDEIVDVPASVFSNIDSAITVSFWCYGDESLMPFNSYVFEGRDTNGYRVINCHLPWSNSRVYWDAGNNGTGSYDRVDQGANLSDFAGKWNHWAFTKDVSTGNLMAFLNGELFMSASSKTRLMSGIAKFRIGGTAAANFNGVYDGKIDEFRVWNKALDSITIKSWMNKSVDSNHPYYNNLQAAYCFDEDNGVVAHDYSVNARHAHLLGLPKWETANFSLRQFKLIGDHDSTKVFFFPRGNYNTTIDSKFCCTIRVYSGTGFYLLKRLPYG
jgi:hypothetical protein